MITDSILILEPFILFERSLPSDNHTPCPVASLVILEIDTCVTFTKFEKLISQMSKICNRHIHLSGNSRYTRERNCFVVKSSHLPLSLSPKNKI